ncbi:hypothetical protein EGT74_25525 [Chitinophaga lutea]|uniref:Uncharacterized protein n=1 Tax=Chitinophaga lutea TaxID=2488634 RepID=A0A3N4PE59_9BACT|nr:hypothetical protein [Chitinophaga lutea]RPE05728.1 hypothetical protein EGT74_25525 [Chitinophaga lutea]
MKGLLIWMLLVAAGMMPAAAQRSYFIEAEDFRIRGGWIAEKPPGVEVSGQQILRVLSGGVKAADALTMIRIATPGTYTVWARTIDYPADRPGTRLFRVLVNDVPMENESGKHGKEGYHWEKAGIARLDTGENVIQLRDSRGNFARVDAVFLTAENIDPATANLQPYKTAHLSISTTPAPQPATPVVKIPEGAAVAATLENEFLKLEFVKAGHLAARTAVKQSGSWQYLREGMEEHRLLLLSADNPQITFGGFFPGWNGSLGFSNFTCRGKNYTIMEPENLRNPFLSGTLTAFQATAAEPAGKHRLVVTYQSRDGQTIKGTWELLPGHRHLQLNLQYTAPKAAYYSLVVTAFQGMAPQRVAEIQLPPMFQYQRIPEQPMILASAMMPQPLAMAELKEQPLTTFITGVREGFPLDWAMSATSVMGFGIKNERNEVQPVALSPVPGLKDAKLAAGQSLQRSFAVGAMPSGWNDALEYISDSIYAVKDYRRQQLSLTETMFNITDLLRNDTAAGWAPALKGFYDIEADPHAAPTVVQSAPLAVVATAILGRDEDFYIRRALPTIEYTLSRSGFRWAQKGMSKKAGTLSPYGSQYTTAYYEGLYRLLGETNPWLKKIALPNNSIRDAKGYSVVIPAWTQELAAYRLTGQRSWLDAAAAHADAFISSEVHGTKTVPLSKQPFYNTSFYAYWWDFTDLFDATGNTAYLKAAADAAFHTLAGVRSYPAIKDTLQTIHPGNVYEGNTTMWWKGGVRYRLGFPRRAGDAPEKKVPESLVSPVGLGFEQPFTFFDPGKLVRHVFMSNWAPHLLRLHAQAPRKIFETYARNAVIGRFTNYPGYYATGFTDITMQPDFPYKGPDVSSIYYHHIPPHLAFTMDYLVTEIMQRSGGKVRFPYAKQDGFVWFNNRIFGAGKGTVMDDAGVSLWLKRGLVTIDNPAVNYVTAVSDKRFWILLTSEADEALSCNITLGNEAPVADNAAPTAYQTESAVTGRKVTVNVGAKGFAAVSFPLNGKRAPAKISVLKEGMQSVDFGPGIGMCYVFRIRSPFGWDSIYGYLESTLSDGAKVTVNMNHSEDTLTAYPFEWSFHPLQAGEEANVKVVVTTKDGRTFEKNLIL